VLVHRRFALLRLTNKAPKVKRTGCGGDFNHQWNGCSSSGMATFKHPGVRGLRSPHSAEHYSGGIEKGLKDLHQQALGNGEETN
jgi:hypothetical protein